MSNEHEQPKTTPDRARASRLARLEEQLRGNLRKRKEQARARNTAAGETGREPGPGTPADVKQRDTDVP